VRISGRWHSQSGTFNASPAKDEQERKPAQPKGINIETVKEAAAASRLVVDLNKVQACAVSSGGLAERQR
jgi:hypothetical protein